MKWLQVVLQVINAVIILTVLNIHFLTKENTHYNSINFYTFPLPIVAAIVLILSVFLKFKKINFIVAGVLLTIWVSRSFKIHIPDKVAETDLEVVFWNASRTNGLEAAFKLNNGVPDILVLVESQTENIAALKQQYPDLYFYQNEAEIFISSKTPIEIITDTVSKYGSTAVHFKTRALHLYAVDVTGSTDVPRSWELGFVNKTIKKTNNTIVLGDFNVPYESKYLNYLKTNFTHTFNEKGNGFRETWFYNIPLLSLDHVWASKDLKVLKTEKTGTFKSDHSILTTYIKR
ncbi:MAG: endonuclease/exonuclease/phosphatase family protein [Flavobacteriaceae bacterium]